MSMRAEDIYERYIKALPKVEQQRLCELMSAHMAESPAPTRRAWQEIAGKAPYPLVGEDAQAWVSRSRREDEMHRQHDPER